MRCIGQKLAHLVSPRVEVVLRICVVTLLSSILSLANFPQSVPPDLKQLIGIFGTAFALSLPHVAFIIGAVYPSVIAVIVIGLIGGTALLAAATVSNGLYVAIFTVWAFYCSTLNYGPNARVLSAFSNTLILSAGMISLGSW